jgi:adenylate kinase family enzyme
MAPDSIPYRRLVVVGTTGSGKSTVAQRLATWIGADFVELDGLHWEPGWMEVPRDVFRRRADLATRAPAWVVAGNYSQVRDIIWPKAEAIVWLDFGLWTIFWRLFFRTFRRGWTQEELWNGNRESFWRHLKIWSAEDSLFHWLFKTYWRRKHEYPLLFALPEHEHLHVLQFRSPRQLEEWEADLRCRKVPRANSLT